MNKIKLQNVISETRNYVFTEMKMKDDADINSEHFWRYELSVRNPFGLGSYFYHFNSPLQMGGRGLDEMEDYLWQTVLLGLAQIAPNTGRRRCRT